MAENAEAYICRICRVGKGISAFLECDKTTFAKTIIAAYMVWNRDTLHRRRGENE